jgi:pimeloyl-ACP methyl ester carboxylesterase
MSGRVRRPDLRAAGEAWQNAVPGLREAYQRAYRDGVPPRRFVQRMLDLYGKDPAGTDPAMVAAATALSQLHRTSPRTDEALVAAARSLMNVASQPRRYTAVMASLRVPVLLIGGSRDPIVPLASVREAGARNQGWETVIMEGAGHTPQLERPVAVGRLVQDWLDRHFTSSDPRE